MRFETFGEQLGKVPWILRRRIHRSHDGGAGGQVVGMVPWHRVTRLPGAFGRLTEQARRPHRANEAHQVAAQLKRRNECTVGIIQKKHVAQPENCGGSALFGLARIGDDAARERANVAGII